MPVAVNNDAPIHQHVAEKEEDFRLYPPPALLHQPSLSDQNLTRLGQESPRQPEHALNNVDPLLVFLCKHKLLLHGCL